MRPLTFVALAAVAGLPVSSIAARVNQPYCGAWRTDIGRGFELTEYMFGGSPEFTLEYLVPNRDVTSKGAATANSPIQITIGGLPFHNWDSPRIGYANFDVRGPDGMAFALRAIRFECGQNISLSASFAKQPHIPPRAMSFDSPFFSEQPKISACLQALQRSGRFVLSFVGDDNASLELRGPLPLRAAMESEHRFRIGQMLNARQGRCQIPPPVPPTTIPSPPPPPPAK